MTESRRLCSGLGRPLSQLHLAERGQQDRLMRLVFKVVAILHHVHSAGHLHLDVSLNNSTLTRRVSEDDVL